MTVMNLLLLNDLKSAVRTFTRNKVRTFLTMLGVIIGVASVIATVSIGNGASLAIQDAISSLGSNLLIVIPGASTLGGVNTGFGALPDLTLRDAYAIRKLPAVKTDSANAGMHAQVIWRGNNWATFIQGASSTFLYVRKWTVADGVFFDSSQVASAANIAVIGNTVKENLFGLINPIGHMILIKNIPFKVIGVLSKKGFNLFGFDQDDVVEIPITTMMEKVAGITYVHPILVSAKSSKETLTAQKEIVALLRQRHHLSPGQPNDFFIRNLTQIAKTADQSANIFTVMLAAVAAVSLLVGGIGIMNIMLVSVTERTKEIGIRMAVGAKKSDILKQFLIESVVLSLLGGFIGVALGLGMSEAISAFTPLKASVTIMPILISIIFSACVGVFFGFYPAYKASNMNPVEALRYE